MSSQYYDPSMYEYPLVGAAMIDESLIAAIADITSPDDFQLDVTRLIWSSILDLKREEQSVDIITVSDKTELPTYECAEIARNTYTTSKDSVITWANIVRNKGRLMRLRRALQAAADEANEDAADVDSVAAHARDMLIALEDDSRSSKRPLKQILKDRIDAFKRRYEGLDSAMGLTTGIDELDHLMFGLRPAEFVLLAARPGMGKSTFALKIADRGACHHGGRVLFFSLEMSNDETVDRLLVQKAGINSGSFSDPVRSRIETHDIEKIGPGMTEVAESDLHFFDDIFTIEGITSKCRAMHQEKPVDLIVIDYLQLITSKNASKYGGNRTQEVGDYSRALKMLAMTLNAPVLALSQLNREVEKRPDKRPLMADLRESGSLEQDANKILMLYIDGVYNEQTQYPGVAEIIVRKNRGGSTGTVRSSVDLAKYAFSNLAPERVMQQASAAGYSSSPFE